MEYANYTNGQKMPIVGLGMCLREPGDEVVLESALNEALKIGYRHFDTAFMYKNEDVLGRVLKEWFDAGKLKREELFITTKLPMNGMHKDRVEHFLKLSLANLQLDYVDLYLIHCTIGTQYVDDLTFAPTENEIALIDKTTDLEAIWGAMEKQVDGGRAKSIGISNFSPKQVERIVKVARIHPENIQVELSVQFQQKELREVCKKHKITVTSYGTLGSPGRKATFDKFGLALPKILDEPVVLEIAKKRGKSAGQILLRHLIQHNIIVIPKSVNAGRLKENFQVLDFNLTPEEMALLDGLDQGEAGRSTKFGVIRPGLGEHPEYCH